MTEVQMIIILGLLAVLYVLSIYMLKSIIKSTIEFEFKKREQAAMVAALFAEWIDKPAKRKELNRLTWEATLWLPDELAAEVNKCLAHAPDAKNIKDILVDIKGIIQGRKSSLDPAVIVHFPKK